MPGRTVKRVANAHRNRDIGVFIRERCCDLLFLCFVMVGFKIIEDGMRFSSRFLLWQNILSFFGLRTPISR